MITEQAFKDAAKRLNCDIAAVKAVAEVESRGGGFNPDGSVKVLFEGHWFYKYTKGKFATTNPNLCYPKWTKDFYGKNFTQENDRFSRAKKLDLKSALLSTSYGAFQVMGFNFAVCGWKDVDTFYTDMCSSEDKHLEAFIGYVLNTGLADELRDHRWADFARLYNGPGYQKNAYDTKLDKAWKKYGGV